jgi:putative acetyltransferase
VAELDKQIVGFGSLRDGDYLDFMYTHSDYQGKGIANSIYADLAREWERLGERQLIADVSKTALSFFKKKGFVVERVNDNFISGIPIINYRMKKERGI